MWSEFPSLFHCIPLGTKTDSYVQSGIRCYSIGDLQDVMEFRPETLPGKRKLDVGTGCVLDLCETTAHGKIHTSLISRFIVRTR